MPRLSTPPTKEAERDLRRSAARVRELSVALTAATGRRDGFIRQARADGVSLERIGQLVGLTPQRVAMILDKP